MKYNNLFLGSILISMLSFSQLSSAQTKQLPFSDMDQWVMREFKESGIIGGKKQTLYEIATPDTILEAKAHEHGNSPWETSSVYAKVAGITKGSSTVFPEKRGDGYAARLETRLEEVVVFGLINLKVLATGTIFTGKIQEPVKDSKDPMKKLMQGIPFTDQLKSIRFDYKTKTGGKRIKSTGFSREDLEGKNASEAVVILQKRWEDEEGNLFAKRIGTGWKRFTETTPAWVNGYELPVQYGDITQQANYESYMGLFTGEKTIYAQNSKGERTPVQEIGWAEANEQPTHLIIRFSAGYGGAYVGAVGDNLWIDNVQLVE